MALAARPALLFLDEPTAGMNPAERTRLLDSVRRLAREGRTTFVVVEHDMDVVFSLSARVSYGVYEARSAKGLLNAYPESLVVFDVADRCRAEILAFDGVSRAFTAPDGRTYRAVEDI